MDEAAGVLFDVNAGDAGSPCLATANKLQKSVDRQSEIILRNLVSLGQIRIEVVLAVELAEGGIKQLSAIPVRIAASIAAAFSTGNAPGNPPQTRQTRVFGGASAYCAEQPQYILDFVSN